MQICEKDIDSALRAQGGFEPAVYHVTGELNNQYIDEFYDTYKEAKLRFKEMSIQTECDIVELRRISFDGSLILESYPE